MRCEKCGGVSRIYICRNRESGAVYRRRQCEECGYSWTTIELTKDYFVGMIKGLSDIMNDLKKK